jgi:hypothetical protein
MTDSRHNLAHGKGSETVFGWGILSKNLAALRNIEALELVLPGLPAAASTNAATGFSSSYVIPPDQAEVTATP